MLWYMSIGLGVNLYVVEANTQMLPVGHEACQSVWCRVK